MYTTVENIESNKVRLIFDATPEQLENGMKFSYNKNKSKFSIPGFRKGKAPRQLIEMHYGKAVFIDDAVNYILPDLYSDAVKEVGIKTVSKPEVDIKEFTEEGVTFTAEVYVFPEVSIDGYLSLTYQPYDMDVSEEAVDEVLMQDRDKNARIEVVEDRPTQMGDIVIIDFEGFVEGVQFDGGAATDNELELGSNKYIPGFEEQLVGYNVGEDIEVNVDFPEEYFSEELAGMPALFKVVIKEIREKILPEVDDDFAQDVSEFDTLEEYKEYIRDNIYKENQSKAEEYKMSQLAERLAELLEGEIPDVMIDQKVDEYYNDLARSVSRQGVSIDTYFEYIGIDEETYRQRSRKEATQNVKARLALEKIAELENITITDEEIEEEKDKIAQLYNKDKEKFFENANEELLDSIYMDIKVGKAMELVKDSAVAENVVFS